MVMAAYLEDKMNHVKKLILIATVLSFLLSTCDAVPSSTVTVETQPPTEIAPLPTIAPTETPAPKGEIITVTSTNDNGPGTLRQALESAKPYDVINFDQTVFPPTAPAIISIADGLPQITQGNLTIDASEAGVVLDGSQLPVDTWIPGLEIVSDGNTVRGLQIINFTGTGIVVAMRGKNNMIGGDRNIGSGPTGQGNLTGSNDFGIGLWDSASNNIVTGNLIGMDVDGKGNLGNRSSGMWIETGTMNLIGPDNVIANNARCGIQIEGPSSVGNTLSQNIIRDNNGSGICMIGGGNLSIAAPLILGFDMQSGNVEGLTCPNCLVEVFSDNEDEGMTFEGQATADQNGSFIFHKGKSFSNSYITATATDNEGNTSTFSLPTTGSKRLISLQDGNELPKTRIVMGKFDELPNNHIGDMFPLDRHSTPCPPAEDDWSFTHVGALGFKWARLSLDRMELNQARDMGDYSQMEINQCQDEMVTLLAKNDVTILYTLVYWDENLHAEKYPNYKDEQEIQRFLDYTRLIVRHFKDRIQYYEILNEALVYVDVKDYVNLIRRTVPVIKEEYPDAKIVVGGSSNLLYSDCQKYLFGVLQSDILPLIDGIATHPMYGASPQYEDLRQYYVEYPSLVQKIKDTASTNGFNGEYFVEEMAWRTNVNTYQDEPWVYTPVVAAKYYARGIVMNLGMVNWVGIGGEGYDTIPAIVNVVQNLTATLAGAVPDDLPLEIQGEDSNLSSYVFKLENGDYLVAVWNNDAAVDQDNGMPSQLIIPNFASRKVTGVDILNGFEQELVSSDNNSNLIINGLLIKDYPILVRISN